MSEIVRLGDHTIVRPEHDLVASVVPEFRKEVQSVLEEDPKELVIDLGNVEMIDSVGLGVLIATHNSLGKIGGKLKVVNASSNICGLFKTMRLDKHFSVS